MVVCGKRGFCLSTLCKLSTVWGIDIVVIGVCGKLERSTSGFYCITFMAYPISISYGSHKNGKNDLL